MRRRKRLHERRNHGGSRSSRRRRRGATRARSRGSRRVRGSASTEQTQARRKPAHFGPRADQEAPQGTSGSSRTAKKTLGCTGTWKEASPAMPDTKLRRSWPAELLQQRRPRGSKRERGARWPPRAKMRDQSHNSRERRRVRHPPGIKELASDTSPIARGTGTREREESDTKTKGRKRDATRREESAHAGAARETMATSGAGAGAGRDRRSEGARANGDSERQRGREGELTCVEALGYGGGLPEESLAERALHARGERIPANARHPPRDPHLLGSSSSAAADHLRTPWDAGARGVEASGRRGVEGSPHRHSTAGGGGGNVRRRGGGGGAPARRGVGKKGPSIMSVLYRRIGVYK
jgi:hypothetical protein